jgi:hypothetical protein
MKVFVDEQEWWPVYELFKNGDDCWSSKVIDVPEDLYKQYQEVASSFNEIQNKIIAIKDGNT